MKRIRQPHPASVRCDQCSDCAINGVRCHEAGCPNDGKAYDLSSGVWYTVLECWECGGDVREGECCDCQNMATTARLARYTMRQEDTMHTQHTARQSQVRFILRAIARLETAMPDDTSHDADYLALLDTLSALKVAQAHEASRQREAREASQAR